MIVQSMLFIRLSEWDRKSGAKRHFIFFLFYCTFQKILSYKTAAKVLKLIIIIKIIIGWTVDDLLITIDTQVRKINLKLLYLKTMFGTSVL
jgi:hypothetical protein